MSEGIKPPERHEFNELPTPVVAPSIEAPVFAEPHHNEVLVDHSTEIHVPSDASPENDLQNDHDEAGMVFSAHHIPAFVEPGDLSEWEDGFLNRLKENGQLSEQ